MLQFDQPKRLYYCTANDYAEMFDYDGAPVSTQYSYQLEFPNPLFPQPNSTGAHSVLDVSPRTLYAEYIVHCRATLRVL